MLPNAASDRSFAGAWIAFAKCNTANSSDLYVLPSKIMDSQHLSKERLHALMFDTVDLTEQEDAHINGWKCTQCQKTMLELTENLRAEEKADSGSAG